MTNPKVRDNQLSFAGLVAICVSAMIGSAIFDLPKNMATVAGATAQILAWITTGIGMWLIAEVFMILSAVKPDLTAGMYDYGVAGFGPFVGFLTAWGYFVSNCATNAAFAVLVMNTLNYFFPGTFAGGNNWPSMIGASLLTWGMTGLTLKGTKSSNRMQKIAMTLLMVVITVLIVSLMGNFSWQKFTTDMQANVVMPSVHNLNLGSVSQQTLATMMVTLWMFSGIEGAAVMAGRAKKRSQVRMATLVGFLICITIDILISLLSLGVFSYGQLMRLASPSTAAILTSIWHNVWGRNIISLTLILTVLASWISWLEMICELPQHAAEQDGTFPRAFAKTNANDQPVFAILVATVTIQAIILMAHFDGQAYEKLLLISAATTIPPYLVAEAYLFKIAMHHEYSGKHHPKRGMIIAGLAFVYTLLMGVSAGLRYTMAEFIVYLVGMPMYLYARRQHGQIVFSHAEKILAAVIIVIAVLGIDVLMGLIKQPFMTLLSLGH